MRTGMARPLKSPARNLYTFRASDSEAHADLAGLFERYNIWPIWVSADDTKSGSVETHAEARLCADLFRWHCDEIDGVLVVLPNHGDEKGVAYVLKLADLDVPLFI